MHLQQCAKNPNLEMRQDPYLTIQEASILSLFDLLSLKYSTFNFKKSNSWHNYLGIEIGVVFCSSCLHLLNDYVERQISEFILKF